ncbi:MAG: hypothetical protein WC279_10265 [Sulfurimonas sp.]|jgi:hypothetical protein|uniref:hypothetical protein n=1 Tax=Sulfurimonas sp. TaxID=2022749 RepID=UPI003564BBCB
MKKVFLALLLGASVVMADVSNQDDLLSQATNGAVTTAKAGAMALSQDEMSEVKGGATWYNSYSGIGSSYYNSNTRAISSSVTTRSSIYASVFRNYYW